MYKKALTLAAITISALSCTTDYDVNRPKTHLVPAYMLTTQPLISHYDSLIQAGDTLVGVSSCLPESLFVKVYK